jgi:transposase InsO family protein
VEIPFVVYEDGVILDSGASSHMTGDSSKVVNKRPYRVDVFLADGSMTQSTHMGSIQVKVFDRLTRMHYFLKLKDCLLVPGFRSTLWSVSAFNAQGHVLTFDYDFVKVILNHKQPNETSLQIAPPFASSRNLNKKPLLPLVAYTAFHLPPDLHAYLQQISLTAFWYEKRMLLLELKETLNYNHPLIPDLSEHTYVHLPDGEVITEEDLEYRTVQMAKVLLLKRIMTVDMLLHGLPLQRKLSRFLYPAKYQRLRHEYLKDICTLNHPLFWQKQHQSPYLRQHKNQMTPTIKELQSISPRSVQHFVFMAEEQSPTKSPTTPQQYKQKVDLELMHHRLGHQSFKSLLAASHEELWDDVTLRFAPDTFCIGCKIATRRAAARGHRPVSEQTRPGEVLFMDLIHAQPNSAPTKHLQTDYYLLIVDALSRYGVLIDTPESKTIEIIESINEFVTYHRPYAGYSLNDISEIHADAGSYFLSQEFHQWGLDHGIKIVIAGSHHQEMNGLTERRWQAIRLRAFCMLNHARLTTPFLHHALHYSWQITNMLPLRGLTLTKEEEEHPASPFEVYFAKKARISRFRVFGCPIVAKAYLKTG